MRTRRLAFFVLLSFIWLQLMACAPHEAAESHGEVLSLSSTHDGHCHHESDSHTHEYLLAPPSRHDSPAAVAVSLPAIERTGRPDSAVAHITEQLRPRSGRDVLLDLSIART